MSELSSKEVSLQRKKIKVFSTLSKDEIEKQFDSLGVPTKSISFISKHSDDTGITSLFSFRGFHGRVLVENKDYFDLSDLSDETADQIFDSKEDNFGDYRMVGGHIYFNEQGEVSVIQFTSNTKNLRAKIVKQITTDLLERIPSRRKGEKIEINLAGVDADDIRLNRRYLYFKVARNTQYVIKKLPDKRI